MQMKENEFKNNLMFLKIFLMSYYRMKIKESYLDLYIESMQFSIYVLTFS